MEMDLLDIAVVNFGFRRSQGFKDPDGAIFGGLADVCLGDNLADFFQAAMRVAVLVLVRMIFAAGEGACAPRFVCS